jgi:uncharacterized protein YgbK (DUF1537 family)
MIRVGILADDLTGAADTALQFVRAGWLTELQLSAGDTAAQALAVTSDSRNLAAGDAAAAVTVALTQLRGAGITHLYKKVDSTLRGQLGAEIRAALAGWAPDAVAVVCPAFPAMGRTLVDGHLRVDGVCVSETPLAVDPATPVTESHLPTLLGATLLAQTTEEPARGFANRLLASGAIVVVDAAAEDDLRRLAEAIALLEPRAVPVGSAGLAYHLAHEWSASEAHVFRSSRVPVAKNNVASTITLVIVTSLQDAARRQASALLATGARHIQPTPAELIDDEAWEAWSGTVLGTLEMLESTLVLTSPLDRRKRLPPMLIPERFADLALRMLKQLGSRVAGVVVTGGDGARALCHALQATSFRIEGEVASGVPVGRLIGGPMNGLSFVTKAGGFGDANTLLKSVHAIQDRSRA